jgi:F0F1-type ATP synthase membrane subunit b/b'
VQKAGLQQELDEAKDDAHQQLQHFIAQQEADLRRRTTEDVARLRVDRDKLERVVKERVQMLAQLKLDVQEMERDIEEIDSWVSNHIDLFVC